MIKKKYDFVFLVDMHEKNPLGFGHMQLKHLVN
jgi:hypothetical protein